MGYLSDRDEELGFFDVRGTFIEARKESNSGTLREVRR